MSHSYYSETELKALNLKRYGKNVRISRTSSIYDSKNISIGDNVRIDDFCILSGSIELGSCIHIGAYSGLFGRFRIRIEDFAGISARVLVFSATDDFSGEFLTNPTIPENFTNVSGGPVTIMKHAIVGAGAIILPGVTLHEGCVVGTASLVNQSLEEWKIYSGSPCRYVNDRKKDLLKLEGLLKEARSSEHDL